MAGGAALDDGTGYYEVNSPGDVATFGAATCYGSLTGVKLNQPIVGMAVDRATGGYWLVASDGGVFAFNAPFLGSTGAMHLNKPVVGMTATLNGTATGSSPRTAGSSPTTPPSRGRRGASS